MLLYKSQITYLIKQLAAVMVGMRRPGSRREVTGNCTIMPCVMNDYTNGLALV